MTVLEGAVQLDRTGPPPTVMLDTSPIQAVSVDWGDVIGCWLMRVSVDPLARKQSEVFELLVLRYRGPFVRVPGEDAFWPLCERYGLALESLSAVAQRDARRATPQLKFSLPVPSHERGTAGTKHRKKGYRR